MSDESPWSVKARLSEAARGPTALHLAADEPARRAIARELGLDRLDSLEADLTIEPWLDGAVVKSDWKADVEQTCGVTLEPFGSHLEGRFIVRVLPRTSRNAADEAAREVTVDLDEEDPPDLVDGDIIDLGAYVVEHLSLEIDPFPRKPDAVFEPPPTEEAASPFAVLRDLKTKPEGG